MEDQVSLSLSTYEILVTTLKDLKLDDIADHLQKNVLDNSKNVTERSETSLSEKSVSDCDSLDSSDDDSLREDNFHTKIQEVKEPLSINVKKAAKFRDRPVMKHIEVYPMRSNPRGLVLIIANNLYKKEKDRRPDVKHDEANLRKLFEGMGFKVITYFDLTGQQIENTIEDFSKNPELRRVDCAFVIISSHGKGKVGRQETEILGIDCNSMGYKRVVCTTIMDYFTAEKCRNLAGKPKIFIFQTCRGKNEQVAVPRHTIDAATSSKYNVEEHYVHFSETMRNYEDMLIVYSTLPGYVSYRDKYNGSWFIQVLCEVFMNYAHKNHIHDLFLMIDNRLKKIRTLYNNCQTPSITSQGFSKFCFINPGLFIENEINGSINSVGNKTSDIMFKCCPDRKANISICSNCDSVYHRKCVELLHHIEQTDTMKVNCCSSNKSIEYKRENINSNYLNENVEELKKAVTALKEENDSLKNQHADIISCEIISKSSEINLKMENLMNENAHLKELKEEMKLSNQLLKEKNKYLTSKLKKKKKNMWGVRKKVSKVFKRCRGSTRNSN